MNGKNEGRKRTFRSSLSKKRRRKSATIPFKVGEGDAIANPQAFHLMEHRRMGGVGIDPINPARRDDADFRHLLQMAVP